MPENFCRNTKNPENGFTLVELAIVLAIIGLLIGGVLRGQELLANARVTNTIKQVKSYDAAMKTFTDMYNNIPGDMPIANIKLPGCQTSNPNNCKNGNGDGMVGDLGTGAAIGQPWTDIPADINSENTQFWKHLALAHLITGVNPSAATPDWGQTHPTANFNGGWFMRYSSFNGSPAGLAATSAHYLVMRSTIAGTWQCGGGGSLISLCAISPMAAAQIDRKMDDGVATTGDVIAVSANWTNGCGANGAGRNSPNGYAETQSDAACDIMFQVK